jgi:hypothetical protein
VSNVRETPDAIQALRDDFRSRLEVFYTHLKLAPPYHSVEKAIVHLTAALKALTPEERQRIAADPSRQWAIYHQAFVESGLNQKHRGIIAELVRSRKTGSLTSDYDHFLDAFRS